MKACILSAASAYGGSERHSVSLARCLSRRGHEVSILVLGDNVFESDTTLPESVSIVEVPKSSQGGELQSELKGLVKILRRLRPDVCINAKGTVIKSGVMREIVSRLLAHRYVTIEHSTSAPLPAKSSKRHGGIIPGVGLWWYRKRLTAYGVAHCPHLTIAVSAAVKDALIRHYGFSTNRVRVVHNGVDSNTFCRNATARERIRAELFVDEDTCVFGAIGRFNRAKRFGKAIEYVATLIKQFPQKSIRLVLGGEGPELEQLVSLAHELGVSDRVHFLPFSSRPWEILSLIDVYLMPSQSEGLPYALLEAMACECVPIASNVGGISEVISEPSLGWLVPANDDESFCNAMREALTLSNSERSDLGGRARSHVMARFDEHHQLDACALLIESIP